MTKDYVFDVPNRNKLHIHGWMKIQNLFLTAQSTQIKSAISVPIKDFIHYYPRTLFNNTPMDSAYFNEISWSGRSFKNKLKGRKFEISPLYFHLLCYE